MMKLSLFMLLILTGTIVISSISAVPPAVTGETAAGRADSGATEGHTPGHPGLDVDPGAVEAVNPEQGFGGEPRPQPQHQPVVVPAGAVGYVAEVHLYYRRFAREVPVGLPVQQDYKTYAMFIPWEAPREHGIEIGRPMRPAKVVAIGDMQCTIAPRDGEFAVSVAWTTDQKKNRPLYNRSYPLAVHPTLAAANHSVYEVLAGGLVYLQHPVKPCELQVFVKLTPTAPDLQFPREGDVGEDAPAIIEIEAIELLEEGEPHDVTIHNCRNVPDGRVPQRPAVLR